MSTETLHIESGAQGLQALLARAVGLDAQAIARLRQYDPETVEVFVTTPFEVVVARRVAGTVGRDGASVSAKDLLDTVKDGRDEIGAPRDASWPGALPPASGFQLLDTLPVHVVRDLADKGQALARQFSGPAGPPSSLMKQTVLTVEADGTSVDIPMRLIFACTNLGLIPGFSAPMNIPRHLRVAALGRWVRVDAPFGSVYHSSRLSLF